MRRLNKKTVEKYYDFLITLYTLGEFDPMSQSAKHSVSRAFVSFLRKNGSIECIKHPVYKWVGAEPTREICIGFIRFSSKRYYERANALQAQNNAFAISEEQAIAVLRNSADFVYEITRMPKIKKEKVL